MSVSGSRVKTLENCFWKIFALSWSSNLADSGSLLSSNKGATPVFVFNLCHTYHQKDFGLLLDLRQIPFSNSFLAFRINLVTLFRALVYSRRAVSPSVRFFCGHPASMKSVSLAYSFVHCLCYRYTSICIPRGFSADGFFGTNWSLRS